MEGRSEQRDDLPDGRKMEAPNSLGLVAVLLAMLQQLKNELDNKNNEIDGLRDELDKSKKEITRLECPLLSLPDELIGHIFSFLSIKDRMKARLCKRLENIESNFKYYVPRLLIHERATDDPYRFNNDYIMNHKQYFVLLKEQVYSIDFFKKIIRNAKFGYLAFNMSGREDFHRELYALIKECDVSELNWSYHFEDDILVDSYVIGLLNTCSKLTLSRPGLMTAEGMHSIYTSFVQRSSKMHSIDFGYFLPALLRDFLGMIGIRFDGKNVFSAKNLEAFEIEDRMTDDFYKHVFDANLEIRFLQRVHNWRSESRRRTVTYLKITLHKTAEELAKAKATKGFVRIRVHPE